MKNIQRIFFLLSVVISSNANGQLWKQYADSANTYTVKKNADKAIEFYLKTKEELKKDSSVTITYARICDMLGVSFYRKRQFEEAEKFYLEAMQIRESLVGKEHLDYAISCDNLAHVYEAVSQPGKAEPLYEKVMKIREKLLGKGHADYAASCTNLAILYKNMGQYDKAKPLYLEAKQIRERLFGRENALYAASCTNLAILYKDIGQYEQAESLYLEAKQIQEKLLGKENSDYAASCNNLANLYYYMGQYEKAELLYLEVMQIREKLLGKEHSLYARACFNISILYENMGQYEKAESLYLEAKQIRENALGKEHPEYAGSCNSLAILYTKMRQYGKAEPLLVEAKQIQEKVLGKEHPDYAACCDNLADLYQEMGQHDKAELLYLEAKQIQEKVFGKEHPDFALTCNNLASLYMSMGQYEKAELLHVVAKQIHGKILGKQHPDYGSSCDNLANLYWLMRQPLMAEKQFKESFSVNAHNQVSFFQFTNEKEKIAFIKNILGEDNKAYSFYLSEKLQSEQPYSLSLFHRNLILSSSQTLKKQLFSVNDTLVSSKYNDWMNLKKYLSILYAKPVDEREVNVAKIEEKAGKLEKELTRLSSSFKNKQQEQNITWQTIHQNLKAGEGAIEFAEFQYYNGKRYTDSIYYVALVLRKNKPEPELVPLFEKNQLDSILNYKSTSAGQVQLNYLYTMQGDNKTKSLYDLIWKPLEEKLNGIKTIYFAPAGSLFKISFSGLPVNSTEVLSDKYQLVQLNTTASVGEKSTSPITASDKVILYGGIQYDADPASLKQAALQYSANEVATRSIPEDLLRGGVSDFYYLSGSEMEVNGIGKLAEKGKYNFSVSKAIAATEESFKALSGTNSPAVLHIATHGFFFPDPKNSKKDEQGGGATVFKQSDDPLIRSGLALAGANNAWKGKPVSGVEDGILTAYEVSNMYLPNTKLAVLSACETGLGDIQGSEGVYGLQRAFKMAGAENLIMSLWKVPDQESSEFMQEFYKNLFAKQTISEAFYHAQDLMKNKYRNDPYKWAAWILVR